MFAGENTIVHKSRSVSLSSTRRRTVCTLTSDGGGGHEHDRQPDGRREDPVADVDDLGIARRPEVQSFDRVAHGNVAVDAHGGEREDGGEHVVVVDGHRHLAQHVPERPRPHQVVDALEGQRAGDQGVSQGEVEDVDVGGCLHFSVPVQRERAEHVRQGWIQLGVYLILK